MGNTIEKIWRRILGVNTCKYQKRLKKEEQEEVGVNQMKYEIPEGNLSQAMTDFVSNILVS